MENWLVASLILCLFHQSFASLQDEVTSLRQALYLLKDQTNKQINDLQQQVNYLEEKQHKTDQAILGLHQMLSDSVAIDYNATKGEKGDMQRKNALPTVAFHACFNSDVNYLGRKQNLLFNKVIIDTNNGYTSSSGTYTIQNSGFYVITWVTPVVGNIPFELIVNGETRGRTDPSSTGNGASQSTTGVALLSLYENDIVILRTHSDATPVGALVNNKWQDTCLSLWKI